MSINFIDFGFQNGLEIAVGVGVTLRSFMRSLWEAVLVLTLQREHHFPGTCVSNEREARCLERNEDTSERNR